MLYQAYQAGSDFMAPIRVFAAWAASAGNGHWPVGPGPAAGDHAVLRNLSAAYELLARAELRHERPPFGIDGVTVGNREVAVREEIAEATPFGALLHFKKDIDADAARACCWWLRCRAISRRCCAVPSRRLLPDHDVYITDWANARDIAAAEGRFGFDDYVAHMIRFLEAIGPGAHVVAVCQPCVAVLVADGGDGARAAHPAQPRSMTLMAGPIDTRINPTNGQRTRHRASRSSGSSRI